MRPLRCAVVGLGRFGRHYVRLLQDITGAELAAVASRTVGVNEAGGHLPDTVWRTADVGALFRHPGIDCVIIATPASTHFEFCQQALAAGKHVLVEKPMVTRLPDARVLQRLVGETGRTFMVGHQYLYNDYIRELRRRIVDGELREARFIHTEHFAPGPVRTDVGCLWDFATHELAVISYLFEPGELVGVRGRAESVTGSEHDDFASFVLTFSNGLAAAVTASWLGPEKVRKFSIVAGAGAAVFDDLRGKQALTLYPSGAGSEPIIPEITAGEPLRNELEHFLESVRAETPPLTDINHGVVITEWLDKISREIRPT